MSAEKVAPHPELPKRLEAVVDSRSKPNRKLVKTILGSAQPHIVTVCPRAGSVLQRPSGRERSARARTNCAGTGRSA